jgi:hypothetical protein
MLVGIGLDERDELDFDAGRPANVKPVLWFACNFAFAIGRVGFLGKLAGGIQPGIVGSLTPVCDASRGRLDGV